MDGVLFFGERNKTQDKIRAKRNAHNFLFLHLQQQLSTTFNFDQLNLRSTYSTQDDEDDEDDLQLTHPSRMVLLLLLCNAI